MRKIKTRVLSLLILCAATSALAQRAPEPYALFTEKEMTSFEAARVSRAEAIKVAANRHKDAKVVDVGFNGEAGQLACKVETYQDNNVWEGAVDARRGTNNRRRNEHPGIQTQIAFRVRSKDILGRMVFDAHLP